MASQIRTALLGEQTAEHDGKLLLNSFVETPEYRLVIETKDSTVIVGRRGTGKSAMFAKLSDFWGSQKGANVIRVAPEDYQTIIFRGIFKPFSGHYSHIRSTSKMIWRYGLLMEMLSHLSIHFKTKDKVALYPLVVEHVKRWQSRPADFFSQLAALVAPILKSAAEVEDKIASLHQKLALINLERDFSDLMSKTSLRFFLLIDRMDEGYENDESGAAIVAGAIATAAELNKKHEHVRSVIFQRDNILRSVQKFDPDYSRDIEGEVLPLHWNSYQLQNLVAKRLNQVFALNLENTQKIWDRCTANEGFGRELQGIEGFRKCLQFTLYRPRDLLLLLNQAFFNAGKDGRNSIVLADVEKTAKTISANRLEDLKKEYSSIFPSLTVAVSLFENGSPELTYLESLGQLDNMEATFRQVNAPPEVQQDYAILKNDGVIRALYSIGFIGTHDENSNTFGFCHDGRQPDKEFTIRDRILIHPCYWIALNLTKNALLPDEAEQINDEYEIKVTSVSPEIRSKKIGSIIASLGGIAEGRENAEEFEEWLLTATQTVFAGHLGNVERKPNGNSVQRRDLVGTNLARSIVWTRIETDYQVRHVVFEAKNYKGVGREEYRQMSTYLTGPYGRLGFLVSRDEDDNLRAGAELDWVREIYHSEKKLIIRLSYKFFTRLLGKLRNPEKHDSVDSALSSILDTYERQYLSLPSSRATKASPRKRS